MTEYLVIFFLTVLIGVVLVLSKNYKACLGVWVLAATCIAGFRYQTGWDYEVYEFFFSAVGKVDIGRLFDTAEAHSRLGFEPGFIVLGWLTAQFTQNYQVVLAATTISISVLAVWRIDRAAFPIFMVVYLWYGYFHNFGILRQGLAAALIFLSFSTGFTSSILLYLAASSIHASSAFIGLLLFILSKKVNKKIVILSVVAGWFLSLFSGFGVDLNLVLFGEMFQRWVSLLDVAELSTKVGVSFILVEYTIVAAVICFMNLDNKTTRFAAAVVAYRTLSYGVFNDTTIAWERTNALTDPMYALALASILTKTVSINSKAGALVQKRLLICVFVVATFVWVKYSRMLDSDSRIANQLSHRDRFVPYKSVLY
jgi:hypothetical protein